MTRSTIPRPPRIGSVVSIRTSQVGGLASPLSTQAACRAAPSPTYSPGSGMATGTPNRPGATARTAAEAEDRLAALSLYDVKAALEEAIARAPSEW